MNYTIQCFVKKVVLEGNCVKSLTIRPSGKSRIDGVEDRCLGWECKAANKEQVQLPCVRLFPIDLEVQTSKVPIMANTLIESKFHGGEIEVIVDQNANKICGVTLL